MKTTEEIILEIERRAMLKRVQIDNDGDMHEFNRGGWYAFKDLLDWIKETPKTQEEG